MKTKKYFYNYTKKGIFKAGQERVPILVRAYAGFQALPWTV